MKARAKLKTWNGPGDSRRLKGHLYVCASSRAEAVELLRKAGRDFMTLYELDTYFAKCWGDLMRDIPHEKSVWFQRDEDRYTNIPPIRLI